MTLVSPKVPHVGAVAQPVSSLMKTHPSQPSAPMHPATLPGCLRARPWSAQKLTARLMSGPSIEQPPRKPAFTGVAWAAAAPTA